MMLFATRTFSWNEIMSLVLGNTFRRQAVDWARALFNLPSFVILDTETTGLGRDDELVSVGIVDSHGTVLLDTLIKPMKSIPWYVTRIHGIANKHVADAPGFSEVYPEMARLLSDQVLVVYNLSFDERMILQDRRRYGLSAYKPREAHCAMQWFARFYGASSSRYGSFRWQKLTESVPPPHVNGKLAVVGHTHDRGGEIFVVRHLICLDTFCYGGGWLTAMEFPSRQIWQADAAGRLRGTPLPKPT